MIHIELTGEQGLILLAVLAGLFALLWVADYFYWPVVRWNARRKRRRQEKE